MPTCRAIILDKIPGDRPQYRVVFWADVPAARQAFYADPTATSQWKDASASDIAALRSGAVAEHVEIVSADPPLSLAQAQTLVAAAWQTFQDMVTQNNPWLRYGTKYNTDGSWTAGGVS